MKTAAYAIVALFVSIGLAACGPKATEPAPENAGDEAAVVEDEGEGSEVEATTDEDEGGEEDEVDEEMGED